MEMVPHPLSQVGVVVIGRNEGSRLLTCLQSVLATQIDPGAIAYVDSGSVDGSVVAAQTLGIRSIELDLQIPFTAARARNAGFDALLASQPDLEFVQFIDGDCELQPRWLAAAVSEFLSRDEVAVVCGRCRERFPERTVYNRLCDIEWNTAVGETTHCGGIAMMRAAAFAKARGFNPALIAGEEPELCLRLRADGGKIIRLPDEMVLHDAAMTRFGQWWKRMVRAGHAYAENAALHGHEPHRHWVKENRSDWFWGAALPLLVVCLLWPTRGLSALALLAYALLWIRIRSGAIGRGLIPRDARLYALFTTMAKFPLALGQARYWMGRALGRHSRIIEYKSSPAPVKAVTGEALP